jgi:electron-transferring-flavoprotein dehydrogenase
MKSGMLAAEAAFAAIAADREADELTSYPDALNASWIAKELKTVRNAEPAIAKFGPLVGTLVAGTDMWMRTLHIGLPFTMKTHRDNDTLWRKDLVPPIAYPKPDGVISFDRLSSVFLSNTNHEEDQPIHLTLKDASVPIDVNLALYDAPEQRYCPAGVYEIVGQEESAPRLQINAQNCVHCKTCDIKDPTQNINWVVPEGGGGPNYPNM